MYSAHTAPSGAADETFIAVTREGFGYLDDVAASPSERGSSDRDELIQLPALRKGTFLDRSLALRGPESDGLLEAIAELVANHRQLRRKPHPIEGANERQLLSCILANGLRCLWYRTIPLVTYQRKADAPYYSEPNRPGWLTAKAIGRAVECLAAIGFLDRQIGERGVSSGYAVRDELKELAEALGVSERSLGRSLAWADLVQLRGVKPRPSFDRKTRKLVRARANRLLFEPTPETEIWSEQLNAYNAFVASRDIALVAPDDLVQLWIEEANSDHSNDSAELTRPELFRDAVYRVFNDGSREAPSFGRGGRIVGAWWINAPEEIRQHIRIDNQPTVELDYSACHPRMLYHGLGLEPPENPYDIPEFANREQQEGREPGTYKPFIKWLTQILINGRGRPDLVSVPLDVVVPSDLSLLECTKIVERSHTRIATAFRSGAGLSLMRAESDIALSIMTQARQGGWLALPIHDSFVAQVAKADELRELMEKEYKARVGGEPMVRKKGHK